MPTGRISTDSRAQKDAFRVWGLTGGVASGKSTAARFFAEAGLLVIDADKITRELGEPGGLAHPAILQRFGTADRAKLRDIVFSDAAARRDLEAILHPLIRAESLRQMKELGEKNPVIVYEAALLVETGRYKDFAGLILVDAPRDVRRLRLVLRDGVTEALADKMLNSQAADEARRAAATIVIDNSTSLPELRASVKRIAERLKNED